VIEGGDRAIEDGGEKLAAVLHGCHGSLRFKKRRVGRTIARIARAGEGRFR
jgi:hypothetical protein